MKNKKCKTTLNPMEPSTLFPFLVIRAIQRSGVSFRAQRRACQAVASFLPLTIRPDIGRQAKEIAAHCLLATKPVSSYSKQPKRPPQKSKPRPSSVALPPNLRVCLEREAAVVYLREGENLPFRDIARRLKLCGPDRARGYYLRACRRRERLATINLELRQHISLPIPGPFF